MSEIDFLERLRTTAWKTAGARYNASRRLQRRSRFSLITISLLSGVGVVAPFLIDASSAAAKFSAFLAMLVLVIGIVEGASDFGLRAATLFTNAEDINAFQSRLGAPSSGVNTEDVCARLDAEYQAIKRRSQFNHEPIDLERFILQHNSAPEFARAGGGKAYGTLQACWIFLAYSLHSVWWLALFWMIALGGFAFLLFPFC